VLVPYSCFLNSAAVNLNLHMDFLNLTGALYNLSEKVFIKEFTVCTSIFSV
jgi:hypothetical protein